MKYPVPLTIAFTLLCLLAVRGAWALTSAGSMIVTQAEASFFDTENASPERVISNQSWVSVAAQPDFELSNGQTQLGTAGGHLYFIHGLINRGNTPDRYRVSLTKSRGSDLDKLMVFEYQGALPAPGSPPLTETRTLQPGETLQLIVFVSIPVNYPLGDSSKLNLSVRSVKNQDVVRDLVDTVETLATDQVVRLTKAVDQLTAVPGDPLRYEIQYQHIGSTPITPGKTEINGEAFSGVLIEDILPAQTSLDYSTPEFAPYQAIPVLRMESGDWQTFDNWNRRLKPTRIGLLVPEQQMQPGYSGRLSFAVRVNNNAKKDTFIINEARLYNTLTPETIENREALVTSNTVYTTVTANGENINPAASLRFVEPVSRDNPPDFYGDFDLSGYYFLPSDPDHGNTVDDVYLELEGGNFADSRELVDTIDTLMVRSGSGATLPIKLIETGVNTGVFRSQAPLRLTRNPARSGQLCQSLSDSPDYSEPGVNCELPATVNDTLTASIVDPITQQTITATAGISPMGTVFSTNDLLGLAGATVTITDLQARRVTDRSGKPVRELKSNADGQFVYPRLAPGKYYAVVTPPANYHFPSLVTPDHLLGRKIVEASYGLQGFPESDTTRKRNTDPIRGYFVVNEQKQLESFDIPLDPLDNSADLMVEKTALQDKVAVGEQVSYKLTVENSTDTDFYNLEVVDSLPQGFSYVNGSTQINGLPSSDPQGTPGPNLTFSVQSSPALPQGEKLTITYSLQAGVDALSGDGINRAIASANRDITGLTVTSLEASAQVSVIRDDTSPAILVEKEALQDQVAPGETVAYQLRVTATEDLTRMEIQDTLPHGFKYLPGSSRIQGKKVADPEGQKVLTYQISDAALLKKDQALTIAYTLQARAGAIHSDGINRARASSTYNGQTITSNEAKAQVSVRMEGVLSDKAILFGKVYLNGQCNGLPTASDGHSSDTGVGGVRLYMEDGTWVITDENGQYSLMGLNPGNHVIKVDPVTLPEGLVLKPLDNRNGADGNSRFADLTPGEMHRADFAAQCPTTNSEAIVNQIKARNESISGDWLLDDAAQYNRSKPSESADSTGDLSNGIIRAPKANQKKDTQKAENEPLPTDYRQLTTDAGQRSAGSDPKETGNEKIPNPKDAIKTVTRQQAEKGTFLWPLHKTADGRFMAVVRAGVQPRLTINGEAVAQDRLGEQLLNNREQAQLMAWYGVPLKEGENQVEIKARDMFGNERLLASATFNYAGSAVAMKILPDRNTLPADDGRSLLPVTIKLLDNHGSPARGIYFVTLESSSGRWHGPDIQDREPGHQIRINNGIARVNLQSGRETGPVTLRASTGDLKSETTISQVAPSRPLMAVGLLELNTGTLPDLLSATGSERDTRTRAALFVKGDIAEETQLTLAYDSDKDDETELFRDVDPDDYYPITGDASEKGYEAQSRSKLYAKIEQGLNSIMWGDYQSDSQSSDHDLARVQRNLNGLNAIYDHGRTRIQAFAARPENSLSAETIEPNGTAMNYRLAGAPIVRHSETVVLEVWSRDNPGLMLDSTTLSRGRDYTLDEFSGYLKFSKPVQSQDSEGNPQKIRVSYEVEGNGEAYTVAGGRIEQQLSEQVTLGASYTLDDHEREGSKIGGVWVQYQPSEKTTFAIATARMTGRSTGDATSPVINGQSGNATRIKIRQQWDSASETGLTWARADEHFTNSSGGVSAGREETRLEHKQRLTNTLNLRAEAEVSRTVDNSSAQGDSAGFYLDKTLGDGWQVTAGSRYIRQRSDNDQERYMTGQTGVKKRFTLLNKAASISAEYEQAFTNNRWRAAVESDWQVHEKASVYGRFERDNQLSPSASMTDRNEFSLGVKTDWLPHTKTYSEYRMRGATDGNQLEWVNGADTGIELTKGLSISPSIEWINTIHGDNSNDGLALTLAMDDKRQQNQRANGRIEYRYGQQQDYYGLDGAIARRLNTHWAGLVREQFRLELPKDDEGNKRMDHTLTLGLARRPKRDNTWHGIYLYQWKEERDENDDSDHNRRVHLFSTHQNRQLRPGLTLSGRLGSKWVTDALGSDPFDSQTTVFDSRLTWDLNRRWDLDLRSGLLSVDGDNSVQWSAGLGLNFLVAKNLRVGVHYNLAGFTDQDLDSEKYNAEGVHFSLLFKFDESIFDWFDA